MLDQMLREGWADWLERDRREEPYRIRHSTGERDARLRARQVLTEIEVGLTDRYGLLHSTPELEAAQVAYEAACAVEDAAVAQVAATWREPVAVEPMVAEAVIEVAEPVVATAPPAPANDTIDYATVLQRARSARNAAEAEERRAMAVFLDAQEARRQAQGDLEEVLATAELYSAPAVADVGEDWDPRLGPDAVKEEAEVLEHSEFLATLAGDVYEQAHEGRDRLAA